MIETPARHRTRSACVSQIRNGLRASGAGRDSVTSGMALSASGFADIAAIAKVYRELRRGAGLGGRQHERIAFAVAELRERAPRLRGRRLDDLDAALRELAAGRLDVVAGER